MATGMKKALKNREWKNGAMKDERLARWKVNGKKREKKIFD